MTNLLLGIPHIARDSSVTVSSAADSMYPYTNLFGGNKTDLFYKSTAASGDLTFTYELPVSSTAKVDYVYIGRANLLQQASVNTITIKAGTTSNYAAATTIKTLSSFTSQALYGPNGDDYIEKFTQSSAYRYWFVNYNATAASRFPHAKFFMGTAFDIGRDPNAPATITRIKQGGAQYRSTFSFEVSWQGVEYAKAISMYLDLYRTRRFVPLVIFTSSWHDMLMGNRVIFCRITEMDMPPRVTDYCDISVTFEEMP